MTSPFLLDSHRVRLAGAIVALALVGLLLAVLFVPSIVARGVRAAAAKRGFVASWRSLRVGLTGGVSFHQFVLAHPGADTVFVAESLGVTPRFSSLLRLRPRPAAIRLSHGVVRSVRRAAADPDTLAPEEPADPRRDARRRPGDEERSRKVRRLAAEMARLLTLPARRLPRLELHDVTLRVASPGDSAAPGVGVAWLELKPDRGSVRLAAEGALLAERAVPFTVDLHYEADDRFQGTTRILIPRPDRDPPQWSATHRIAAESNDYEPLRLVWNARVHQERAAGRVTLLESSTLTLGEIPIGLSGTLDRKGPALHFALGADSVTRERLLASLPVAVLGPLAGLAVRGSFDYRLSFHLDLARPDSVDFTADVIPHGLRLDPARSRLNLSELHGPFTARIHLPRGRIETRLLEAGNPHFRPLASIDSLLVHAVVTNEDGAFFRHRGFNTEAVKGAIAANLAAGAYRRGAGTITMQLMRNLYLGHERTLSRKAQEVALAWVVEHLTGVPKTRLLEIYLSIIEWGPGVHGADEAAWFYFGHDAGHMTVDEALFLATVVPAPSKWRHRFDRNRELRPFVRAQMHFIGRAMAARGRLDPAHLPPADSLRVALRGLAGNLLTPLPAGPDSLRAPDATRSI